MVTREQLKLMKKAAVLVDVSIDQGGCFETSRPTTHSDPTYEVDGVTYYCVANMPGAVPITSTFALTNATLPYVLHVADRGAAGAAADNPAGPGLQRRGRQGDLRAGGGGDGPGLHAAVRVLEGQGRVASRRLAATVPRRMPTTSQLVRKGRKAPKKKLATPGLKSGKGRKKKVAAPQRRGVCTRLHDHAEEAELGAAQGRPCAPDQWHGGHGTSPARATTCRSTPLCSRGGRVKDLPGVRYKVVRGRSTPPATGRGAGPPLPVPA